MAGSGLNHWGKPFIIELLLVAIISTKDARGYEQRGEYLAPLAAVYVDKMAIRNDILEKQPA